MECPKFKAPPSWNNCVLGEEEDAETGQGFLNFQQNWYEVTTVALIPGDRVPGRSRVLFPRAADIVHVGDELVLPRRFKVEGNQSHVEHRTLTQHHLSCEE